LPKEGLVKKLATFLFGLIAATIGWVFYQNFDIRGWENFQVVPRDPAAVEGGTAGSLTSLPPARSKGTIRVASFNIQVFGTSKSNKPHVMDILARIVREFDLVAIQEIRAVDQDILPNFVDVINATGCRYDYVIGPRLGRTNSKEQYAFVYDMTSIEVDRSQLYTVSDPDDLLHREPLVGWFRARGIPPEQAFTFSLVNIHTDPDETDQELDALDDVFQVVRHDGRQEDDVILLGDLNVDDQHMGQLGQISGISWVISGTPTNVRNTAQYDNIVFHSQATREFSGRGGVYDFLRRYNLSLEEALEVSDHMPVWAEFSVYEGGEPGRIAGRSGETSR
jgi:endonuclease/exonuclease/phosphatase family metal-dependent hydrolase